ncbi:hypothetical protein B0H65DRAFT_474629 [Neurospora tetraspora]|uniref:U6 small nuclear RNA (adenine-(43)-N(6))-methyltransferase n=1 Tax=Neurospora tetraspora TaxID=94610 RepID=A0AAE0MPI1_9PEZI|nr:hypothetical protein B0H65DRAFT_474629 [Neurospora tetraspora]
MGINKRKAPEDESDAGRSAAEEALNSPVREPEAKRQKHSDSPAIAPADQQQPNATKPTPESDRPHNDRAAPISGPGQAGAVTRNAPRKWTDGYFRELYTKDPSFKYLGQKDPDFAPFLDSKNQLDFTNPAAVMQLTKTLLQVDYGLTIELPPDRLCPPVPNRHNYILWLTSLLSSSSYHPSSDSQPILGLDIGTGASAIYPLLGCVQHPSWSFIATDIDSHSLSFAQRNIQINNLEDRITLLPRHPDQPLIPLDALSGRGIQKIDFCMCNPPFYSSPSDLLSSAAKKSRPPLTACTGAPVEMVCEGGEVAHIFRMIEESLILGERVRWYTSMVGKVTSLEAVVERLRREKVGNYAVTELVQGKQTKRWAVGWSFGGMRAGEESGRGVGGIWKRLLPAVVRLEVGTWKHKGAENKVETVVERVKQTVEGLELMSWEWEGERMRGVGRSGGNVWSRAWRRRREREMKEVKEGSKKKVGGGGDEDGTVTGEEECKLGFEVVVEVAKDGETKVLFLWREGHDQAMFESLVGYLQGKMKDI